MLCICIFSNELDLNQAIRVSHNIVIFHFLQFSRNFFIAQTFIKLPSVRSSKNYAKQVSIMESKIFIRLVGECRKSDTQFKFSKFSFPIFNLKFSYAAVRLARFWMGVFEAHQLSNLKQTDGLEYICKDGQMFGQTAY